MESVIVMKNKKFSVIVIFLFLISLPVFSEIKLTGFSFSPEIGFFNGKIVENVWYAKVTQTGNTITYSPTNKMSRLDWQIKNSFFVGAEVSFVFNDKVDIRYSFKNAFAQDCGIMEDYDWLKTSDPDYLSRYSQHTNYLETLTQADFTIGWNFYIGENKNISITPRFGVEVQKYDFSGNGGWRKYDTENFKVVNFGEGKVISYSQSFASPVLILSAGFNFLEYFETFVDLSGMWIPYLCCIDTHHLRNALFNDRIMDTYKFEADLGFFYKINKMHKVGFKGNISYIPESYGFTYSSTTETTPDASSLGGTNRLCWSYSFVYCLYF